MEDNEPFDFLCDESLDASFRDSEPDFAVNPESVNVDLANGWPYTKDNFLVLHYNINSITAEGRLEELSEVISNLKVDILVCTESKLCNTIPINIVTTQPNLQPNTSQLNTVGVTR